MVFYFWAVFLIINLHQISLTSGIPDPTSLASLTNANNNTFGFVNASCFYQPWFCELVVIFQYEKINQVESLYIVHSSFQVKVPINIFASKFIFLRYSNLL